MGGPTEVVNDEGIRHTTGTQDAGDIRFYRGLSGVLLISKSTPADRREF